MKGRRLRVLTNLSMMSEMWRVFEKQKLNYSNSYREEMVTLFWHFELNDRIPRENGGLIGTMNMQIQRAINGAKRLEKRSKCSR